MHERIYNLAESYCRQPPFLLFQISNSSVVTRTSYVKNTTYWNGEVGTVFEVDLFSCSNVICYAHEYVVSKYTCRYAGTYIYIVHACTYMGKVSVNHDGTARRCYIYTIAACIRSRVIVLLFLLPTECSRYASHTCLELYCWNGSPATWKAKVRRSEKPSCTNGYGSMCTYCHWSTTTGTSFSNLILLESFSLLPLSQSRFESFIPHCENTQLLTFIWDRTRAC